MNTLSTKCRKETKMKPDGVQWSEIAMIARAKRNGKKITFRDFGNSLGELFTWNRLGRSIPIGYLGSL